MIDVQIELVDDKDDFGSGHQEGLAMSETEYDNFSSGLKAILKADPKAVKAAMEEEKKLRAENELRKGGQANEQ